MSIVANQHVARLEISVHDARAVQELQCLDQLHEDMVEPAFVRRGPGGCGVHHRRVGSPVRRRLRGGAGDRVPIDGCHHRRGQARNGLRGSALPAVPPEVDPAHVLHREEQAVLVLLQAVQRHDAGVAQGFDRAELALALHSRVCGIDAHALARHDLVPHRVMHEVDDAHAAAAEPPEEHVAGYDR